MGENENKKRRIARIGRMPSGKGAGKLCNEEMVQADCNLVYNIMQSMNKSQNVMSYQQLQECRLKEKATGSNNADQNTSSKLTKISNSKQIKRFAPEKSHPLMAKCQKSMKYLNKNRCIPKPRAHVGFIPRPSQNPISRFQPNNSCNSRTVSSDKVSPVENSMKNKETTANSSLEFTNRPKKAKFSHSVDSSCDTVISRTESSNLESKSISDTDSENEFEQFLQKHHPEKYARRKAKNSNTFKRKKNKKFMCAKKITKITSKTLSESEESGDMEVEYNALNVLNAENTNIDEEFDTRRFRRIVEYENSEDSATDTHVHDIGTSNCDLFSSSEDENAVNNMSKENVEFDANRLDMHPAEQTSSVSSISLSERENNLDLDALKFKCKIPCYVVLERDLLLDKRVVSLRTDGFPVSIIGPISNSYKDEDDCIIINETSNNLTKQNSESTVPSPEEKNSSRGESSISCKSFVSNASTKISEKENEYMLNLEPRSESNEKSSFATSSKFFCNIEKEIRLNHATRHSYLNSECAENPVSQHTSDLPNNEIGVYLNNEKATAAIEKEVFNVQILSVKSLNESDIIVLSDDNEEIDTEAVPTINETKENATEDSDVEIICLDSTIKTKCSGKNVKDVLNEETENKINGVMRANSDSSSTQPLVSVVDDCIILDDLDLPSKSSCTAKNVGIVQQSLQVIDTTNSEKTNSNKYDKTTLDGTLDSDNDSILKILGTIDFNCINKVLKETSINQTENIPVEADNSFGDNTEYSEISPETLKQSPNDACISQKQTSIDASSLNTSSVDTRVKHPELVQNSNVLLNKSSHENETSSMILNNIPSSDNGFTACNNSNLHTSKSFDSQKEMVASSPKTETNALLHSRKNLLLPVCTKMEIYESPSDELDIIAANYIQNLDEVENESIVPLLELYRAEYERFMEIKCTEQNVTAGLKLLEEKQARKLLAIASSIKNVVKNDKCFQKINNEYGNKHNEFEGLFKKDSMENDTSLDEMNNHVDCESRSSESNPDVEDKTKIFNQSVFERVSEVLKSDGPSSSQEVYNHLINSVCANCGQHPVAACSGCAKIYYCSETCGISYWNKGHYATCRR